MPLSFFWASGSVLPGPGLFGFWFRQSPPKGMVKGAAAPAGPAGRSEEGWGPRPLVFGWRGSHSEVRASSGGAFQATWTRPPLRNSASAGALGGVAAGQAGDPKSRSRGCLSPASLVPCPMPRDRHQGGSDRALDSGVTPWNLVPSCPATRSGALEPATYHSHVRSGTHLRGRNAALNMARPWRGDRRTPGSISTQGQSASS